LPSGTDPLLGQVLAGRYVIQRKLGEGGMGAVYLATHNLLEKQVALKVLHGEFVRKPDLVERFMQEAKAASRIRHENVIDISDFGTTPDGLVFFAMELLQGHDLHEEIARARLAGQLLPWERSKKIFLQICAALEAAHALGIVHRDLKPENIYLVEFLGEPDFVKLLDFGIAKLTEVADGERKLTRTGMLFGTPEYMSPEQARGEPVDARIDIYAMGCILFQLVTGRVPFEAENFMGVLTQHLTQPPPVVPAEVLDSIGAPRTLAGVIDQALAKDRNQRHATVQELARAVRRASGDKSTGPAVAQANVPAPVPTPAPTSGRVKTQWTGNLSIPEIDAAPQRRSRLPLIVGAIVIIGGAAATAGMVAVRGGATGAGAASGHGPASGGPSSTPSVATQAPVPEPSSRPSTPAPPAAPPDQIEIRIDSVPSGAEVKDLSNDRVVGRTPVSVPLPSSHTAHPFALHHEDYVDAVVDVIPDGKKLEYATTLHRVAGAQPVHHATEPTPPGRAVPTARPAQAAPQIPPVPPPPTPLPSAVKTEAPPIPPKPDTTPTGEAPIELKPFRNGSNAP
jgi:serine/threonine-protein kinase